MDYFERGDLQKYLEEGNKLNKTVFLFLYIINFELGYYSTNISNSFWTEDSS
jgi:hypothetical protein